jgi:SAM-dependent methyltransferase
MGDKQILDIGCGPTSMLLRAKHGPSVGVDPLKVSNETQLKYAANNIEFKNVKAEDYVPNRHFDEVWIYNCLQHTDSPSKILQTAALSSEAVRIFEWINMGVCPGHPQNLTDALFKSFFPADKWNLVIWNTGILHDFGGTVTNNYIAIHAIRKGVLMRMGR